MGLPRHAAKHYGLIETWDVLKLHTYRAIVARQDSLIETWDVLKWNTGIAKIPRKFMFNRNMGCIEISLCCQPALSHRRLIETWDVLKYTDVNKVFQYGYV